MSGFIPKINADYMAIATAPRSKLRVPVSQRKKFLVKDLQERHRQILRLKFEGLSNQEVARQLMISPQTVCDTVNSQLGREHLAAMHEASDTKAVLSAHEIMETAREAHQLLKDVIRGEIEADVKTRVSVASDYMSRAGFAPVQKSQVAVANGHFTADELSNLKERVVAAKVELLPENVTPMKASH